MAREIPKFYIRPVPGRHIRVKDPYTFELLKAEGEWKPKNQYWVRQVSLFGDVEEITPPKAVEAVVAKKHTKPEGVQS